MKNKILLLIILLLIPLSLYKKEKDIKQVEEIKVYIDNNDYELSLNDYLIGVVGKEVPASFNIEALKAQAIVSRTFAMSQLKDNKVITSTASQAYATSSELKDKWKDNYDKYISKIQEAVNSTKDLVITYNDEIIKSYYFSMSNGYTTSSKTVFNEELPYIDVVDSSFDNQNKNFESTTTYTYDNFTKLLNIPVDNKIVINNIERDETNRVTNIVINNKNYKGTDFRKLLSLRSTDFNIQIEDNNVVITTKGYGHGVGMSQYGANYLANKGYNYVDIINYYYKNVEIKKFNA